MLVPKLQQIFDWRDSKTAMVFMVAPSFPIDYPYPALIGMLQALGGEVTELTFGAKMVNISYARYIEAHPEQRFYISTPCPVIVNMIKTQFPTLVPYLVPVVSPMVAMARIGKKFYPNYKIIMISPCLAKEPVELKHYPGLVDAHLTFKDLALLFDAAGIKVEDYRDQQYSFNRFINTETKIYPMSGGLAHSARLRNYFSEQELCIVDGMAECLRVLKEVRDNPATPYRFIDILSCAGGCVGGVGLKNLGLLLTEKNKLVLDYKEQAIADEKKSLPLMGSEDLVNDLDFTTEYWL